MNCYIDYIGLAYGKRCGGLAGLREKRKHPMVKRSDLFRNMWYPGKTKTPGFGGSWVFLENWLI